MKYILLPIILSASIFLSGCVNVSRLANNQMKEQSNSIFNPEALYQVPPDGLWVESLVDISQDPPIETGPMFIPPGSIIGYDITLVSD